MKILICDAFDASLPAKLAPYGEVTTDLADLPTAEVALVRSKTKCTREWLDKAPQLKLIIRGGVGIDNIDVEYAKSKNIVVRNTPAASSIAVAELTMALMLAVANRITKGHQGMLAGEWLKKQCDRFELYEKTLGLIGIGRIGQAVAQRARAFGMHVIAYDKFVSHSEVAQCLSSLDELLAQADVISLHTPLTAETEGLINKETIAKMKDGVILVNTGRGKCVVEEDVAQALHSGKIRGYGNDVWYSDPPQDSPLVKAPNVVLTPHIGASTKENLLRIGEIIIQIIEEFQKS